MKDQARISTGHFHELITSAIACSEFRIAQANFLQEHILCPSLVISRGGGLELPLDLSRWHGIPCSKDLASFDCLRSHTWPVCVNLRRRPILLKSNLIERMNNARTMFEEGSLMFGVSDYARSYGVPCDHACESELAQQSSKDTMRENSAVRLEEQRQLVGLGLDGLRTRLWRASETWLAAVKRILGGPTGTGTDEESPVLVGQS
ncbi:hypothetical protein B0J13DRAFT_541887 [Dactylonectria estremocensis]|uniref:Uncharacterized protein n=1 Tax=Dactylonectria estremocensis TaxID=1079267 RepID=A0A9P9F8V9_9HYPO|nr:hypothetical protein B0J13DRAFT_541887 [Dactylonectria estremocensis]